MEITNTIKPKNRTAWREWLSKYHNTLTEIWLLFDDRPEEPTVKYLDAVEEAICFGWIDGIQKSASLLSSEKLSAEVRDLILIDYNIFSGFNENPYFDI